MTERSHTYILYSDHGTTLARDSEHASDVARSNGSMRAVVFSVQTAAPENASRQLSATFSEFHADLFRTHLAPDKRITIPVAGLILESDADLCTLSIAWSRRLLHVELEIVDHIMSPWPRAYRSLDTNSIRSIVGREVTQSNNNGEPARIASEVIRIVSDITDQAIRQELREISERSLGLVSSEFGAGTELLDQKLYVQLIEFRTRAQSMLTWMQLVQDSPKRLQLYASAISECDALSGSIANIHLLHLSQYLACAAESNANRDRLELAMREEEKSNSERRERNLTIIAAAFVFPTVFLSFLGINVIPESVLGIKTQSEALVLVALLVAILFAVVGGLVLRRIGRGT